MRDKSHLLRKCHHVPDKVGTPVGCGTRISKKHAHLGRYAMLSDKVEISGDDCQQIIEPVRKATCKATDCLKLPGLEVSALSWACDWTRSR